MDSLSLAGLGAAARWKRSLGAFARKQEEAASSVHTWLLGSTAKAPKGCSLTDLVYGNYSGEFLCRFIFPAPLMAAGQHWQGVPRLQPDRPGNYAGEPCVDSN
eukprot:217546-Pelagomonas_calceolata.AAC.3